MSQEQYNILLSNLLREKRALAKLRVELEGEKGAEMPQNKFEVLKSRVMQCGVEERVVRSVRMVVVRCFKCEGEGHKCRECPLWERKVKRVARPRERKAHQGERRPAHPVREEAQGGERRLRRMEEEKTARSVKGEAQQE